MLINYPAPDADVTITYTARGERSQMVDGVGTTTWLYDQVRRPITITGPFTGTVGYGYDAIGNRTSLKYPDGKVVTYTYDSANRLIQVQASFLAGVTAYVYDSANRLLSESRPNGITSTYGYDSANRLLTLNHRTASTTVAAYTYTVDAIGNRTQVIESGSQTLTSSVTTSPTVPAIEPPLTPITSSPAASGNITVTTTADDLTNNGNCSLREAIRAANRNLATDACPAGGSADIILLPAGIYTLTLAGSDDTAIAGDLDITGTLTLQGAGATATIISGASGWTDRLFHVFTTTLQINGLTLQGGNKASDGGALKNQAGGVTP